MLKHYEEFSDLPEDQKIFAYTLSEIAIEETASISLDTCLPAIHAKLEHRNKTLPSVILELQAKEMRLKKMWETRLSMQMSKLPPFDSVYRAVKRKIRQLDS